MYQERRSKLARAHTADAAFRALATFFGLAVLLLLGAIMVSLAAGSVPALRKLGLGFFFTSSWNPVTEQFGVLAPVYGTIVTSIIALLVGVPISFGIALFLTEMAPSWARRC